MNNIPVHHCPEHGAHSRATGCKWCAIKAEQDHDRAALTARIEGWINDATTNGEVKKETSK